MYTDLTGFSTTLVRGLPIGSVQLPINTVSYDQLLAVLPTGNYSYLQIRDGRAIEFVKLHNRCGLLYIERGVEATKEQAFPCGSVVSFILTAQSVRDIACQSLTCEG